MNDKEKALAAMFGELRTCFNLLKSLAEQLHRDLGVNPSMRAVLEALADGGAQTVPAIARGKGVSRQHIQTIMNASLVGGLVADEVNPASRKSPLFALTAKGEAMFREIREREKKPLQDLAAALDPAQVARTGEFLGTVNRLLQDEIRITTRAASRADARQD